MEALEEETEGEETAEGLEERGVSDVHRCKPLPYVRTANGRAIPHTGFGCLPFGSCGFIFCLTSFPSWRFITGVQVL